MSQDDELIYFDVDVFQEALDSYCEEMQGLVKKAIRSTMGKTRRHAKSRLSSEIRKKWNIKKKHLDMRINVRVGNRGQTYEEFEIAIKGTSISLAYFGAVEHVGKIKTLGVGGSKRMKNRSKSQGVTVEVLKGKKERLSGAWMQYVPSWGMTVRRREGRGRDTARIQKIISPASMYREDAALADRFDEGLMDFIERTFAHELDYRLTKNGYV